MQDGAMLIKKIIADIIDLGIFNQDSEEEKFYEYIHTAFLNCPDREKEAIASYLASSYIKYNPKDVQSFNYFNCLTPCAKSSLFSNSKNDFYLVLDSYLKFVYNSDKRNLESIENVQFIDEIIINRLNMIYDKSHEKTESMQIAVAIAMGVFFKASIMSNVDISSEINFLKVYQRYFYRMMIAKVQVAIENNWLNASEQFKKSMDIIVQKASYNVVQNIPFLSELIKNYMLVLKMPIRIIEAKSFKRARKIDPLYHI